ncbi:hypothetical protein DS2_16966 [Catenovulum agarivorans DS-2]|uniref:Ig-like domain-containing protein n=1 Tax=Catenovulum agarivorans DS-2 TaxID=1328313 RepID=W7Q6V9_9ALTE|nr:DUF3019 domain-containing protein [Catenovulum agarivorans]EWH08519.1 hypothetical protein DS2_16966 [Catenovulum agarivorans DS-2]
MFFRLRKAAIQLFCVVTLGLSASTNAENIAEPEVFFTVKPLVCIVERLGQSCKMQALFRWQYTPEQPLCIWQDDTKLFCTTATGKKQRKNWTVELKQSTVFSCRVNDHIVAKQTVEVAGLNPPQYRRRLHSDWSLF